MLKLTRNGHQAQSSMTHPKPPPTGQSAVYGDGRRRVRMIGRLLANAKAVTTIIAVTAQPGAYRCMDEQRTSFARRR